MKITTVGVDLAKIVFQVHGVDERGKVAARKQLKRAEMSKYFANLEPCLIGMEACGSAHYWARKLESYGHTVKLMAPQFVKPYVKTNKNDMADAEAICEAVGRPNMRFSLCSSRSSANAIGFRIDVPANRMNYPALTIRPGIYRALLLILRPLKWATH
jgi:transposase